MQNHPPKESPVPAFPARTCDHRSPGYEQNLCTHMLLYIEIELIFSDVVLWRLNAMPVLAVCEHSRLALYLEFPLSYMGRGSAALVAQLPPIDGSKHTS